MDCLCLILQAKQGLIHLNKRAVQPAVAALRTGSEEWDYKLSKRATEGQGCRQARQGKAVVQKRGSLHFRQILLCTKTRQDKQTVHVSAAWLGRTCSWVELWLNVIGTSKWSPLWSWKQEMGGGDYCVVWGSQRLLHFTQSTWQSHLHTLPPCGQWQEVQLHAASMEDPGVSVWERGGEPAFIMSKTKHLLHTLIHDMCMLNMAL